MSLALQPIRPVKVIDPELDFNKENVYAVLKGSDRTSWKPIVSTSYSNSSASFSAPPPSPDICVSRNVKLVQPVTIDFIGNAPLGQALLQSQYDAPRAYPLSSNMNSIQLDLNNTSFSINMSDTIQALLRYHNPDKLKDGNMSTTPSTLDKSQQYSDLSNSIHNPLGSVIDTALGGIDGRGAFPYQSITNNISAGIGVDTTAQVQYNFSEDLYLSPLIFGTECIENGFIGLQTLQLIINWASDLTRFWCHDNSGGTTLSSISVTLGAPTLLFQYKTPDQLQKIPSSRNYPYYEIQRYPTDNNSALGAGLSVILPSSNIQLNSIPRMIYVYARKRNSDLTFLDTDTFLSIESISINWANNSGLLSSATKFDLYQMSKKNGCALNWRDWSGESSPYNSGSTVSAISGVGSILAIEFGTDIGLRSEEAPGMNGTYQLQLSVNVTNRSAASITPTLYVVVVNEGVFTIENNSAYSQIGVISKTDVINANQQEGINYNDLKYMSGASIFKNFGRKLSNTLRKISSYTRKGVKVAREIAPIAKDIYDIAKLAGMGMTKPQINRMVREYGEQNVRNMLNEKIRGKGILVQSDHNFQGSGMASVGGLY
jgi:Major capsid protein V20 C-terminal domain/Sputnik virophage major capsid protein 1st domain